MVDKISWSNETRKLSELEPWARNPRQINKRQAERLVESFDQFGQVETIAIGPQNQIYNGHQRLNVLKEKYGDDYEVAVRVASRALTEKEREKLVIFLHKGAAGDWDFDMLANEFELDDLLEWGFEPKELDLDLWAPESPEDVEPQIDKAEELREKWGVESGQLWQLGEHRLICGDCTDKAVVERMMQGEVAGAVVTDPPYGMNLDTDFASIHKGHYSTCSGVHGKVIGDDRKFNRAEVAISAKEEFWWGADYYLESLETGGSWVVWDKTVGKHIGRIGNEFELCYSKKPHKRVVIRHYWVGFNGLENEDTAKREHPTQKPLEVIEVLLKEYVDEQAIIVDPFLGSGTTLIACERLGRKCRAVEISPAYCAVAIQRWVDVTGGTPELVEPVMEVEAD